MENEKNIRNIQDLEIGKAYHGNIKNTCDRNIALPC
jgi:hypothetical protein